MMGLPEFLVRFFEDGNVLVPTHAPLTPAERAATQDLLTEWEGYYRQTLPENPPAFDLQVACSAAELLLRVCQCLVDRDLEIEPTLPDLTLGCPAPRTASQHYSADLVLRFLPDVWQQAQRVSAGDPLLAALSACGALWPLSSVGIPDLVIQDLDPVLADPCLRIVYTDRLIERADRHRLTDRRAAELVQVALGAFNDLSTEMSAALRDPQSPPAETGTESDAFSLEPSA
ncbi:MAG: hypothetical protein JSS02_03650 [Planctomycetes bacterium]|nr:hypothetical protein [Planctomycetota bacterium]